MEPSSQVQDIADTVFLRHFLEIMRRLVQLIPNRKVLHHSAREGESSHSLKVFKVKALSRARTLMVGGEILCDVLSHQEQFLVLLGLSRIN